MRATPERFCQGVAEERKTRDYGDIPLREAFKKKQRFIYSRISTQEFPLSRLFGFPTISEVWGREEMGGRGVHGAWRERERDGER